MNPTENTSAFALEWLPPASDMADLVNTYYVLRAGPGLMRDVMPAYSAQIAIYIEGSARMQFPNAEPRPSQSINFNAPLLEAIPFELHGPVLQVGASLTPMGWAMLSGLPADEVNNCSVEPRKVLSESQLTALDELIHACRRGASSPSALCEKIGQVLRETASEPRSDHQALVGTINAWLAADLNPQLEDLYAKVDLSQRQVQRLCKRFFGVPPSQLLARYRAIRAGMLFADEQLPARIRDQLLDSYYDQAHLIRDVRRYTGRTPKGFTTDSLAQETLVPEAHGANGQALLFNPNAPQRRLPPTHANDSQKKGFG